MRRRFVQALRGFGSGLWAICLVAFGAPTAAQAEDAIFYPPIETHLIRSKFVSQTYKIQVMRPPQKSGENTHFPVIYAVNGNAVFDVLKGISYSLQSPGHESLRYILVGIGYPGDSPLAGTMLCVRDLTFPGYIKISTKKPAIDGVPAVELGTKDYYGAEDFQKFIANELIPFIDHKYLTIPGDRTYFGHSVGGGFGLFTLFTQPTLFRNYIISSPGVIFDGETSAGLRYDQYDFVLRDARKFIASHPSLNNVRVVVTVGTSEEFEPEYAQWKLTSSFYRLAALLNSAAIQGLQLNTQAFPGEIHETVWPVAFSYGARILLERDTLERR
jgi:predicted alpha/beta superfamily hydrolase